MVQGDPGHGKSRLLTETRRLWDLSSAGGRGHWLEGRSLSFGRNLSYWPFIEILRRGFGIKEDEADALGWDKLAQGLQPACDLRILAGLLRGQPGDIQPGCSQDGAEFIVQLTRQSGPFGLAGMLQSGGQITGHAGVAGGGAQRDRPGRADPRSADTAG